MTEEQKEILIAKMLDAPTSLLDEELDLILGDDELRGLYEASAALSGAFARMPQLDMQAEWSRFRPRLRRRPSAMRRFMRVAAVFLGVIVAAGIAVRLINHSFSGGEQPPLVAHSSLPILADGIDSAIELPAVVAEEPVVVAKPRRRKAAAAVEPAEPEIDIDEYLRIQQARIDNDLAMQAAQSYIEEYNGLVSVLDAVGASTKALDNMIISVTIE